MKKLQKIFAMLLAVIMMMGLSTVAFAAETDEVGNIWYGDELSVDVVAGTEGYTFMSQFKVPTHGYEFAGHHLNGESPQTFIVIDTVAHDGTTWTPSGLFDPTTSNYDVTYCCDVETLIRHATYYKRVNLEDSTYYTAAEAAKIRGIVTNAYPYISLEAMKANLVTAGVAGAADLTRNDIIAAVQAAIWACANGKTADDFRYEKSFNVTNYYRWGQPLHDTTAEMGIDFSETDFVVDEAIGARINALVDYLLTLDAVAADKYQVVVSNLEIKGAAPVIGKDGAYQVALQVALNNSGSSEADEITINIYVNDELVKTQAVELGTEIYDLTVEASADDIIKAEVVGIQNLPYGVYFYAPRAADVDPDGPNGPQQGPDGIATVREASQNLVSATQGATPIHDSKSLPLEVGSTITATLNLQKVGESGKALTGAEFALYVKTAETAIKVGTYAVDENGQLTIGNLLPNNYELRETVAPAGYILPSAPITFTVTEDGIIESESAEIAEGVMTVVNELIPEPPAPETTDVYVTKQWVGDTAETRPASVDVQLLRNGVVYDTVTLTANNGWAARWFGLDIDATWTVAEASVPAGYTASVAQNGNSFVITNTFGVELPEPPVPLQPSAPTQDDFFIDDEDIPMADVPATGDPLTVMAAMSALSAAGVYFTRKKRDEE